MGNQRGRKYRQKYLKTNGKEKTETVTVEREKKRNEAKKTQRKKTHTQKLIFTSKKHKI